MDPTLQSIGQIGLNQGLAGVAGGTETPGTTGATDKAFQNQMSMGVFSLIFNLIWKEVGAA